MDVDGTSFVASCCRPEEPVNSVPQWHVAAVLMMLVTVSCSFASEVLPLLNNLLENREMQLEVDLSRVTSREDRSQHAGNAIME